MEAEEAEEELEKLRSELITSMARVEDEHYRMILSLMVRMMYTHENFILKRMVVKNGKVLSHTLML